MLSVLLPLAMLFGIILIKKIPYIGGNVNIALIVASLTALCMAGIFNPLTWVNVWISGIDRTPWVLSLAVLGSRYAEIPVRIGTMTTVL